LLTDRGSEFKSGLFAELMRWMEIDKLRITVFHPSCNGVVERFRRTLNSMLVTIGLQRDWDERLPIVLAVYRATPHESTEMTPNKLFISHKVRMPIDLVMGLPPEDDSYRSPDDHVAQLQKSSVKAYELARIYMPVQREGSVTMISRLNQNNSQLAIGYITITHGGMSRGHLSGSVRIPIRT